MRIHPRYIRFSNVAFRGISLLFLAVFLSGCSTKTGQTDVYNSQLGSLNEDISCPQSLVPTEQGTDTERNYTTTADITDKDQWITVHFKYDINGETDTDNPGDYTFNYFPIAENFPIAANSVDKGLEDFVDGRSYLSGLTSASGGTNNWVPTSLLPLITTETGTWTEIVSSTSAVLSGGIKSEIYTMRVAHYCDDANISQFNPYEAVSANNFPAIIYVLYKPSQYGVFSYGQRSSVTTNNGISYQGTAYGMLFNVYYSVYHYNRFFTDEDGETISSCEAKEYKQDPDATKNLTPPWDLMKCNTVSETSEE